MEAKNNQKTKKQRKPKNNLGEKVMVEDVYSKENLEKLYALREKKAKEKPKEKPKEEKAERRKIIKNSLVDDLEGRRIRVYMLDGKVFEGIVKEVAIYDFILNVEGKDLLMFKHSINYIEYIG
jgi:host factor-I protein